MSCRTVLPQKPPVAQLHIQFPVFYTTRQFITIFPTASLTPYHPLPLAQPPSVLTYIFYWTTSLLQPACSVHFKHNADTAKWGTISDILKNQAIPNLTYRSHIGKNAQRSSNLTPQQHYPNIYIYIKYENGNKKTYLAINTTPHTITNTSPTQ